MPSRAEKLLHMALSNRPRSALPANNVAPQRPQPRSRLSVAPTSRTQTQPPPLVAMQNRNDRVQVWLREQQAADTDTISVYSSLAPSLDVPDWFLNHDEGFKFCR
ncbi:Penicillin-binding protein 1A [Frankliniella fusca]|uniref:Penicillin-binding protein 1A n=1 Tax=Frankliniella fusca TaxID=407009 RepID=A0AAE1LRT3_9NEOP|nr:Penicillin-binding protein 1A [Frankliniella fusca]